MNVLLIMLASVSLYSANHLQAPVNVQTVKAAQYVEVEVKLTAYTCYDLACITASGERAAQGTIGVPVDSPYKMGTVMEIDGLGQYTVGDHGTMTGDWFDIWFETVAEAKGFGVQYRKVRVYG